MGDWRIISTTGVTVPAAPNATGFSVAPTATYIAQSDTPFYTLSGTISIPTSNSNISHLKKIHCMWQLSGGQEIEIATLYPPNTGWTSTVAFQGPFAPLVQPSSNTSGTVTILVENDDGQISSSPLTATVSINGAYLTAISAYETSTGERYQQTPGGAVETYLTITPTFNGSSNSTVTFWIDQDNGQGYQWAGWMFGVSSLQYTVFVPITGQTSWGIKACTGRIESGASIPSSAVSYTWTMTNLGSAANGLVSGLIFTPRYGLINPGLVVYDWAISGTMPNEAVYPNFWQLLITVEGGSGTTAGAWSSDSAHPETNVFAINYQSPGVGSNGTFSYDPYTAWGVAPASATYRNIRFRAYIQTRDGYNSSVGGGGTKQTGSGIWSSANSILPQSDGSAIYVPTTPSGSLNQLDLTQAKSSSLAPEMTTTGGSGAQFGISSLSVAKLSAGTAQFSGTVTFQSGTTGPNVVIQSTGVSLKAGTGTGQILLDDSGDVTITDSSGYSTTIYGNSIGTGAVNATTVTALAHNTTLGGGYEIMGSTVIDGSRNVTCASISCSGTITGTFTGTFSPSSISCSGEINSTSGFQVGGVQVVDSSGNHVLKFYTSNPYSVLANGNAALYWDGSEFWLYAKAAGNTFRIQLGQVTS